jgi:hypothetical protein
MEKQVRLTPGGMVQVLRDGVWTEVSKADAVKEVQGWIPARSDQLVLRCRRTDKEHADYIFCYPSPENKEVPLDVGGLWIYADPEQFGKRHTGFRIIERDPRPGKGDMSGGTIFPVFFEVTEVLSVIEKPPAPKLYAFQVQEERWTTTHKSMSALELKHFVRIPANYSCHQEHPVKAVFMDNQAVDLTCSPRFIFVPPANY